MEAKREGVIERERKWKSERELTACSLDGTVPLHMSHTCTCTHTRHHAICLSLEPRALRPKEAILRHPAEALGSWDWKTGLCLKMLPAKCVDFTLKFLLTNTFSTMQS